MPDWEDTFRSWKNPSSESESAKCENAESKIRAAIRDCPVLSKRCIDIFAQGSYRNNTNVRLESDVDICVRCSDSFFYDLSQVPDLTPASAGIEPATYMYSQFRDEVGQALVKAFGGRGVTRGNKAFDVHQSTTRVDADVVATFVHRGYYHDYYRQLRHRDGTEFAPDNGGRIINWPDQHYANGVQKNKDTGSRFKYITRVVKRLRYKMEADGVAAARNVPSYLIECLVYNAPNDAFGDSSYVKSVRFVLAYLFNGTLTDEPCSKWVEVNGIKYLFHFTQPWTRLQAAAFVQAAWNYLGLK